MRYNVSYAIEQESNKLYAYIKELNILLQFVGNEWLIMDVNLDDFLSNSSLDIIDYNKALLHTYGISPHRVFKRLGYDSFDANDEPCTDELFDTIGNFIRQRKEFAKYDYYMLEHNKEQSLKYKASELDEHYDLQIRNFLNNYYYEFLNRKLKNEFDFVVIYPQDDDFVIEFDKTILI